MSSRDDREESKSDERDATDQRDCQCSQDVKEKRAKSID